MTIERFHSRGQHIRLFIGTKRNNVSSKEIMSPPPRDFLKWICTEMQSGAFWDTILRNVTVCALTSSRLDDFFDIVTYILYWWQYFWGGSWAFWGRNVYPSNTLDRTLKRVQFPQGSFGHRYGRRDVIWKRSITRQYSLWNIRNYLRMTISQLCIKQICLPSIISNVTSNTTNFVEFGWRVDNVWIVLALCFGLVTTPARKSTSLKTSWPMPHPKQIFRKSSE